MRVMGLPPQRIKAFDEYVGTLRPLLRGEEALYRTSAGDRLFSTSCRIMALFRLRRRFRCMCLGLGRSLLRWLGGGDGAVLGLPASGAMMENTWAMLASENDRLDRETFYTDSVDCDWGLGAW